MGSQSICNYSTLTQSFSAVNLFKQPTQLHNSYVQCQKAVKPNSVRSVLGLSRSLSNSAFAGPFFPGINALEPFHSFLLKHSDLFTMPPPHRPFTSCCHGSVWLCLSFTMFHWKPVLACFRTFNDDRPAVYLPWCMFSSFLHF